MSRDDDRQCEVCGRVCDYELFEYDGLYGAGKMVCDECCYDLRMEE